MFSRLALAVALVAAVLLALATVALSAPAHALPSAPAPEHHLERRQRPAAGTCGGYQVPGTTDQYYVVCELDPATGAAKGPFSVGDTSLIFEVIPKAVGPNMSKFVAYAANGGWDGNYGSARGAVVRIAIRGVKPPVVSAQVSTNNLPAGVVPKWFFDSAQSKFVLYDTMYPLAGIFSCDLYFS